jgi:hypothetical protein
MLNKFFKMFLLAVVLSACARQPSGFIAFHDNGVRKPVVALVPLMDHTDNALSWAVSEEVTESIREYMLRSSELFLIPEESVLSTAQQIDVDTMMGRDISFAKKFAGNDYVVFLDLVKYDEVPYKRNQIKPIYPAGGDIAKVLTMSVAIRVVDLRREEPRLILQEVLHSNHMIPVGSTFADLDYESFHWGRNGYRLTPVGQAHSRLSRDLALQVEEYIVNSHQIRI